MADLGLRAIDVLPFSTNTQSEYQDNKKSRVSNQNGVSLLYVMLEIHNSGPEPLICKLRIHMILTLSEWIQ